MYINDHETSVDLLYYESISKTIVKLIKNNFEIPLSIGIHGDWGAGKSSILNLIENELSEEDNIIYLRFNGWLFQGFEDAKIVLIESIINELLNKRSRVDKVKDVAQSLFRRINWLKVAKKTGGLLWNISTGLPSPDQIKSVISGTVNEEGILNPDESSNIPEEMHGFREDLIKLLNVAQINQLVVLIDDLDRCLPDIAIETLEAIRLFLFVPKTAFIIAADEGMIEYSVRKHFPDLPTSINYTDYARNYLEKLIQIPFRIPALGNSETCTYITLLFMQQLLAKEDFQVVLNKARQLLQRPWTNKGLDYSIINEILTDKAKDLKETLLLCEQIASILGESTKGNPRQIKRFINSLLLRQEVARNREFIDLIKTPILTKLMLIEMFEPDFYKFIANLATNSDDGVCKDLIQFEELVKKDIKDEYPESIKIWKDNIWLKKWVNIQPEINKDMDLRPYIFVAKDKKQYINLTKLDNDIEELIEILLGDKLAISSNNLKIKRLSLTEAAQVFEKIAQKIKTNDTFDKRPKGILGLQELVKSHPDLQSNLINLLEILPSDKLGTWALNGWEGCFSQENAIKIIDLIESWKKTNKKLSQIANIRDKI